MCFASEALRAHTNVMKTQPSADAAMRRDAHSVVLHFQAQAIPDQLQFDVHALGAGVAFDIADGFPQQSKDMCRLLGCESFHGRIVDLDRRSQHVAIALWKHCANFSDELRRRYPPRLLPRYELTELLNR